MGNITLGRYMPLDSPVHKMDPRAKIMAMLLVLISIFFPAGWIGYGILFVAVSFVIILSKLSFGYIWKSMKPMLMMLFFLLIINIFMLLQGLLFSRGFAQISRVPKAVMVPCIIAVCCMGGFAIGNTTFEVSLLIAFGLIGYLMRRFSFPIPPLTIGLVLGELFETNLRRSLVLSNGSASIFFTRPLCVAILIFAFVFAFLNEIKQFIAFVRNKKRSN